MASPLKLNKTVLSAPLFKTAVLKTIFDGIKGANSTSQLQLSFDSSDFPKEIRNVAQFRTIMYMIVMEAAENPQFFANTVKMIRGQRAIPFTRQFMGRKVWGLELQLKERLGSSLKAYNAVAMTLETMTELEKNPEESLSFYRMFFAAVKKAQPFVAQTSEVADPMVESVLNRADHLLRG